MIPKNQAELFDWARQGKISRFSKLYQDTMIIHVKDQTLYLAWSSHSTINTYDLEAVRFGLSVLRDDWKFVNPPNSTWFL